MGICKCKKKSEDFCYNHKKFICSNCVVTDHTVCYIDTYVNWLTNSDFQNPICEVCKSDLTSDNAVRLGCYHIFHPECIDVYANSLPANTASAGYGCPKCSTPIIPNDNDESPLAINIKQTFSISPWAEIILSSFNSKLHKEKQQQQHQILKDNSSINGEVNTHDFYGNNDGGNGIQILNPLLDDNQSQLSSHSNPYGAAIRKQQLLQQQTPISLLQNHNEYGNINGIGNINTTTIGNSNSGDSIIQFADTNPILDLDDDKYNKKITFSNYYQNHILTLKEKPLKLVGIIIVILFFLYLIFRNGSEPNEFQPVDNNKE